MYKNQLQELAQRSCFNMPSYTCIREGPDHAPRFKATVNFNGETFESPSYCSTLRQAEHSAAEVALGALAGRGPSNSLAARILDETGIYKNLLQEVSQRVGACLPTYTTFRNGLGHISVFTCTVKLAGVIFTGDPAKTKKQAEKNAAMSAWFSLKSLLQESETSQKRHKDEPEHVTVARALQKYLIKARLARVAFPIKFPNIHPRPVYSHPPPPTMSKLLPLIYQKTAPQNTPVAARSNSPTFQKSVQTSESQPVTTTPSESHSPVVDNLNLRTQKFPATGAAPYIPVWHCNPHSAIAPSVTIRNTVPVFSAPPPPPPQLSLAVRPPALAIAPPVSMRQAISACTAPVRMEELPLFRPATKVDDPWLSGSTMARIEEPLAFRILSGRLEESPLSKLPVVRVEEPYGCEFLPDPMEEVAIFRTLSGRLEESPFSKISGVRVKEPLSHKLFPAPSTPNSGIPKVQLDLPSSKVFTVPIESAASKVSCAQTSAEATRITMQDKLQASTSEIEDLKTQDMIRGS